jgi:hypothetical protein
MGQRKHPPESQRQDPELLCWLSDKAISSVATAKERVDDTIDMAMPCALRSEEDPRERTMCIRRSSLDGRKASAGAGLIE